MGAHERRFALDERHGLALHVGTHERAVASSFSRTESSWRPRKRAASVKTSDVIDFIAALENELPALRQLTARW